MSAARGLRGALLALALALAGAAVAADDAPLTPAEHRRGADQTFLTLPEWYLVHSPAELARYLADRRPPSDFPWFGHIGQFWQSYRAAAHETRDQPFNAGYHLMVFVIGASTTVEYALRSAYENTLGRAAEAASDGTPTPEEQLDAHVAQQYVDFIRVEPWYRFDFMTPFHTLWSDATRGQAGGSRARRWERRVALSLEYLSKAGYAWVIGLGTASVYDEAKPVTAVVLDRAPATPLAPGLSGLVRLDSPPGTVLATVPRYRAFMTHAQALAAQEIGFVEIAGNRGEIVASVIERTDAAAPAAPLRSLFVQPVLTQPGWQRRVVALPVPALSMQLRRWQSETVQVEHVYDY